MDIRKITQLAQLMSAHDLAEVSVETADIKLLLRRGRVAEAVAAPAAVATLPAPAHSAVPAAPQAAGTPPAAAYAAITSPIVGTFYLAPSPDAPPFVKPGDKIGPETVVCIVEAMKVMNEIKAETSGTIRRVLVDNATPVEFGQPLFEIEPA